MSARTLISIEKLPPRTGTLDRVQIDTDIRAAMAALEQRLYDRASKYHVGGYVEDGEVEFDHAGDSSIVGKLRIVRPE